RSRHYVQPRIWFATRGGGSRVSLRQRLRKEPAHSQGLLFLAQRALEFAIFLQEQREDHRNQHGRFDSGAEVLRMQLGVTLELDHQGRWDGHGQLRDRRVGYGSEPQFHSGSLYGRKMRSRFTTTRRGSPGRAVRVGWMSRLRRVIS